MLCQRRGATKPTKENCGRVIYEGTLQSGAIYFVKGFIDCTKKEALCVS